MSYFLEERTRQAAADLGLTEQQFLAMVERETSGLTTRECVELAFPQIELEPEPLDAAELWGTPPPGGYRVAPTGAARNVRYTSGTRRNTRYVG